MELNLNQITDKLNAEFVGDTRKLIFWYDDNAEFVDEIDTINLTNAKIYHLQKDNQFMTKYFLEREDTTTNYLIYAPFPKPELINNHLADTIRYSKEFFADRASLICLDLGIKDKYKEVIVKYIKFFGSKERTQRFYQFEIESFNTAIIETAIMSVLCKTKIASFEDVVRVVITADSLEDNIYLSEFEKYNIKDVFWKMCEETFGYTDNNPTLSKFVYTLFVSYMAKVVGDELSSKLKKLQSYKTGNIIAFLDSLMNSTIYSEDFEKLSKLTFNELSIDGELDKIETANLLHLDLFIGVDKYVLNWVIDRLSDEDLAATLSGKTIIEVCELRKKLHFGKDIGTHYHILQNAYYIIGSVRFEPKKTTNTIVENYVKEDYMIDQRYRFFYYYYDKLEQNAMYENLVALVENIYTNRYLNPLCMAFSEALKESNGRLDIVKQQDFYSKYVKASRERVVVIISDALRYEVGMSLLKKLTSDEKCDAKISTMQSVIPSYTRFGMSALLPHKTLEMTEKFDILVDGKTCNDIATRETMLRSYNSNSRATKFDEIKTTKQAKELTTGMEVIYLYHDQIDARGDKLPTENEVFNACEEAVEEIHTMIKRLTSANNTKFIITADHGFIYKRDKLSDGDKIKSEKNGMLAKRYYVSEEKIEADGVFSIPLNSVLKTDENRYISLPMGSDIFTAPGGGQNFVHGGASVQELIIPVIEVKTNKSYTETKDVPISIVSLLSKVTNLNINIDFIQNEPVTDVYKQTAYKLYFITDDNEKISNDNIYIADKKDKDGSKRVFRLKFTFKNKKYDNIKKYYLIAVTNDDREKEVIRHEVKIDMAFVDDFGF